MPGIEGGYLTVPRRVLHLLLTETDPALLSVFFFLLEKARIQAGVFHGVPLERGQYLTGRQAMALALRMSEKEIRNRLAKLAELELIAVTTTNRFTIVTITNFVTYSGLPETASSGASRTGKMGQPKGQQNLTLSDSISVTYGEGTGEKGQQKGQDESEKGPLLDQWKSKREEYIDISAYLERSRAFYNLGSRGSDVPDELPSKVQEKQRRFFERAMQLYPAGCRGFTTEWKAFKQSCPDWVEVVFYLPAAIERYRTHLEQRQRREGFAPAWPSFQKFIADRYFETELKKAVERWNEKYRAAGREEFVLPEPTFLM